MRDRIANVIGSHAIDFWERHPTGPTPLGCSCGWKTHGLPGDNQQAHREHVAERIINAIGGGDV